MVGSEDLVYSKDSSGNYQSGGYSVKSCLFGKGAMVSESNGGQSGGSASFAASAALTGIKDLAVPAGLLYLQQTVGDNNRVQGTVTQKLHEDVEVIGNDLYDDLLMLVSPEKRKLHDTKTRKKRASRTKNTRKVRKSIK